MRSETESVAGVTVRPDRLHYAWVVAGVTFAALLVAGGVRGSPGILVVPLETEFGWSRATISLAIGINILLYGWRWMALTLAAVAMGLIPLVASLMRNRPEDIGLRRYGERAETAGRQTSLAAGNPMTAAFGALALGLRSRNFWLIGGAFFICG